MPSSDFVATIIAGGQRYTDWQTVMVRRDYGDWQSSFHFTAAEPRPYGKGWDHIRLKPGDACQIELGGVKVIDGFITSRLASIDERRHDLVIAGKSNTQHLEGAVKVRPGNYNGKTFEQIARAVMDGSGVGLKIINPPKIITKPFKDFTVQYGETIAEVIERMARFRGLFLTDDADGNLVASQVNLATACVAELEVGRNILRGSCKLDNQNAFSTVAGAGQQPGNDQVWPPRDVAASVSNPNALPGRTKTIVAEAPVDVEDLKERLNFEAANDIWTVVECSVTVVGWKMDDGDLWDPTANVSVYAPSFFPNESGGMTLGIQACIYAQDDLGGTTTTLELKLSGALTTAPSPFGDSTSSPGAAADPVRNPNPNQAQADQSDMI